MTVITDLMATKITINIMTGIMTTDAMSDISDMTAAMVIAMTGDRERTTT